jgi:hypothetical protein
MGMSLKVWRNRARGNNEPLIPDIPLNVDVRDDNAVRLAVLASLKGSSGIRTPIAEVRLGSRLDGRPARSERVGHPQLIINDLPVL